MPAAVSPCITILWEIAFKYTRKMSQLQARTNYLHLWGGVVYMLLSREYEKNTKENVMKQRWQKQ